MKVLSVPRRRRPRPQSAWPASGVYVTSRELHGWHRCEAVRILTASLTVHPAGRLAGRSVSCTYQISSPWGRIYKISYNLSYDYRKSIVRSTYDSDLKRAEISLRNIVSQFTNTIADDITILHVNLTLKSFPFIARCCVN